MRIIVKPSCWYPHDPLMIHTYLQPYLIFTFWPQKRALSNKIQIRIVGASSFGFFFQPDHETRRFIEQFAKSVKMRNIFILKNHTLYEYWIFKLFLALKVGLQLEFRSKSLCARAAHFATEFFRFFLFFPATAQSNWKSEIGGLQIGIKN